MTCKIKMFKKDWTFVLWFVELFTLMISDVSNNFQPIEICLVMLHQRGSKCNMNKNTQ